MKNNKPSWADEAVEVAVPSSWDKRTAADRLAEDTGLHLFESSSVRRVRVGTEWLVDGAVRVEGKTFRFAQTYGTREAAAAVMGRLLASSDQQRASLRMREVAKYEEQ